MAARATPGPPRTFTDAVAETGRLLAALDEARAGIGRAPATLDRSIFASCDKPDPFASLVWFDEDIGINEVILGWPPDGFDLSGDEAVPAECVRMFEQVAAQRIGRS